MQVVQKALTKKTSRLLAVRNITSQPSFVKGQTVHVYHRVIIQTPRPTHGLLPLWTYWEARVMPHLRSCLSILTLLIAWPSLVIFSEGTSLPLHVSRYRRTSAMSCSLDRQKSGPNALPWTRSLE